MKFDKEHLVKIGSLAPLGAGVFLDFLLLERRRHMATIAMCETFIELWGSELKRQVEEVQHIDNGIKQIKEKFGYE